METSQTASAHEGGGQSVAHPPPAQGASATVMAKWIEDKKFSTTRLRPGYDEEHVNVFLDAVRDTFLGQRKPPVTANDVKNVQFEHHASAARL